jgi:eukaryotic translation initiation factor 2C
MVLHNKYADDKFAQEFGIEVSSDLVTVPARVLPPPLVKLLSSFLQNVCP